MFARARAAYVARYAASRRVGRPVWLTRAFAATRALVEPWAWVRRGESPRAPAVDLQRWPAAVLRAVAATPEVTGVFVWKWSHQRRRRG
ncbi:MAG: hypothetical protein R3A52_21140 [Polyangiales bacterium]